MISLSLTRMTIDGVELEYEERGAGEPVLLIHGAIVADAFAPLLADPVLTDRYRAIAYHRRGFAGSSRPTGAVSLERQAEDARDLLFQLGIERAHIVGHSYGGAIALQLALQTPAAVGSLALLEPGIPGIPAVDQLLTEAVGPAIQSYAAGDKAEAIETFLRGAVGPDTRAALDRIIPGAIEQAVEDIDTFFQTELPALLQWRFGREQARRVTQPTLLVSGDRSDAATPMYGTINRHLRDWLPRTEQFVLREATHALQIMNPRGMAEGLTDFFARHRL